MNHIYRIVFNRSLGVYQCVSEIAKAQGKSSGRSATTNRRAGFSVRALSISILSVLALGTTTGAVATTYGGGITYDLGPFWTVSPTPGDVVTDPGTLVIADNLSINETLLRVTDRGAVEIAEDTTVDEEGHLIITGLNTKLTTDDLVVGYEGTGSVTIADGASVKSHRTYIGDQKDSEGELTVTGKNSKLNAYFLVVGSEGTGIATIAEGGSVEAVSVFVGNDSTGNGELTVTGANSTLTAEGLDVGAAGKGSATIADGGFVDIHDVLVGGSSEGEGDLTVTGANSKQRTSFLLVNNTGSVMVADGGSIVEVKTLLIENEGNVTVTGANSSMNVWDVISLGSIMVADGAAAKFTYVYSRGDLTVTGANSKLTADTYFLSEGSATIADGAEVQAQSVLVGYDSNGEGDLTITGNNSKLNAGYLFVGFNDTGDVTIADGGSVEAGSVLVGRYGNGKLNVTGANSTLTADDLVVGLNAEGTLNIIDNGLVIANSVSRDTNSKLSVVNFNNGTLKLGANQSALFNNFTGADTINLAVSDETIGGGTIDTNNFNATVFNDARITGSGSFTKAGKGTLTMNSATKAWDGNTHINQGMLQLNGDYTMRDGEVLGIGLNTLTDYGQLQVTGNADISQGTLQVNAAEAVQSLAGAPVWNNVVSANNLTGEFVVVNDNSLLVSFLTDYSDANSVHLKMVRDATFVDAIESEANQTALGLAGVLDLSISDRLDNNTNALADALISSAINFDKPKLAAAANELQPLLMGASNRLITDSNYAATEAITERSLSNPQRGLWAKIIASDSSLDEDDFITGYDADSYGAIVGIDSPINDRLSLGVAVSYIDNDVDSDSRSLNHEMRAKNWQVLGYGNYAASDATQVNFHAGAGSSDVKGKRHISILTNATANSDYSVDTLQAGFGIGHQIGNELRSVTPFAQMNYARAKSDGYRETGAGVYNLNVDDNTYESMRWTAGVKMSQALTPKLALTGQLAAALENGDRRSDITASFIELPDASFTTSGQEIGREIGILGVGLSYMPTANTKLSAGYRGEWRDNYNDQGASIALQTFF